MEYVVVRRAKINGISIRVNLPYGYKVERFGDYLFQNGCRICSIKSETGRTYFSPNADGNGLKRGELIRSIKEILERQDSNNKKRWDRIWGSLLCKRYQNTDHLDVWVWNQQFYEAPIEDLERILALVSA